SYSGHTDVGAYGTSGHGGFIEVSGRDWLGYNGSFNALAVGGRAGTLLLDPTDMTISNAANSGVTGSSPFNGSGPAVSNLNVTTLQTALGTGNVTIQSSAGTGGNGDITFVGAVAWNSANSLTVNAARHLTVNNTITNTGTGNILLNANIAATGDLTINNNISTGGSIGGLARRDLTLAAGRTLTTGAIGSIGLRAANGSTTDTGSLYLLGTIATGNGGTVLSSGINGTRPDLTLTAANFLLVGPMGQPLGNTNIQGFRDISIQRNMQLRANTSFTALADRDLTLTAGNTITTVNGGVSLRAAGGSTAGTGNLNLLGNLSISNGSLTLLSGINGTRPNLTLSTANLPTFTTGPVNIRGFNDLTINRALSTSAAGGILLQNNNRIIFNNNLAATGTGTITISDPLVIGSGSSVSLTSVNSAITLGSTVNGVLGGAAESLTINSGTATTTFGGAVDGLNLTATAGTFSLAAAMGATTPMGNVSLTSTNALTLPAITASSILAQTTGTNITLGGNITTANGPITFNNNVILGANQSMNAGTGTITFGGTVNGANTLTTSAGATNFSGAVGGSMALNGLTVTGAANVGSNITSDNGPITFNNNVTLTGNSTMNVGTGAITFGGTVNGANDLTVNAGITSFASAVGGTDPLNNLSVATTNALTLPTVNAATILARTTGATADVTLGGNLISSATSGSSVILAAARDLINSTSRTITTAGTARWLIYSGDTADATIA
ncbi:MAG: beta strand repeat-containing protein, partial [bacterium]